MKNKVKFGLSNVHYAVINEEDGTLNYGTPTAIPGAVNLQLDAEGEITPFYADNVTYYQANKNGGYSGSLEIADIPKSFYLDVLGYQEDTNGALIENEDAVIKPFALMYEVKGDVVPRKAVLYNCAVSRPGTEAATQEDTTTPATDTLNISAVGRTDNKNVKAVIELSDTNKAAFDSFYDRVYEPKMA